MKTREDFPDKLNRLILLWTKQGVQWNRGMPMAEVEKLGTHFGFLFDKDFLAYLAEVNGFEDSEWDKACFSFWSLNRMYEENGDASHLKDVIWFADYMINLCSFGFHKVDGKVYTHYQAIDGIECVANSFSEFIDIYLQDPKLLFR